MIVARHRKFCCVYSEVENVRHKIVEGARLGDPFSALGESWQLIREMNGEMVDRES